MFYTYKHIVIENYKRLKLISDNKIIVDDYSIEGANLKIRKLDDFHLDIEGIVEHVDVIKT